MRYQIIKKLMLDGVTTGIYDYGRMRYLTPEEIVEDLNKNKETYDPEKDDTSGT